MTIYATDSWHKETEEEEQKRHATLYNRFRRVAVHLPPASEVGQVLSSQDTCVKFSIQLARVEYRLQRRVAGLREAVLGVTCRSPWAQWGLRVDTEDAMFKRVIWWALYGLDSEDAAPVAQNTVVQTHDACTAHNARLVDVVHAASSRDLCSAARFDKGVVIEESYATHQEDYRTLAGWQYERLQHARLAWPVLPEDMPWYQAVTRRTCLNPVKTDVKSGRMCLENGYQVLKESEMLTMVQLGWERLVDVMATDYTAVRSSQYQNYAHVSYVDLATGEVVARAVLVTHAQGRKKLPEDTVLLLLQVGTLHPAIVTMHVSVLSTHAHKSPEMQDILHAPINAYAAYGRTDIFDESYEINED